MLISLATACYRRRRLVLGLWLLGLVLLTMATRAAGDAYSQSLKLPASDSQRATELVRTEFSAGDTGFSSGEIVFKADAGATSPAIRARLEEIFAKVAALRGVKRVDSPYGPTPQAAFQLAPGGQIGYATVVFDAGTQREVPAATVQRIARIVRAGDGAGLQLELGGNVFRGHPELGASEWIGLLAAVVILLVAFGSVVAMGLPILTALFGLGVGFAAVGLLAHGIAVPQFATQLAAMIGLGVGIDYALFIVTRYRQGLDAGLDPLAAVRLAIDTAGRAVLFAGCTVVISLAGMVLIGIEFVRGLGLSAAAVVAIIMAASLTLLPALLGFAGRSIDRLHLPGTGQRHSTREGFWFRWSQRLQARPLPYALLGLLVLVLLATPVLSMRLGSADDSNLPRSTTTRRAYDLKAAGYGVGASGPLLFAVELPVDSTAGTLAPLQDAIRRTRGVAFVAPARLSRDGRAAVFVATPTTSSQDAATSALITRLRAQVLPKATAGTGLHVYIGGITAAFDDLAAQLQRRLPLFIAVVLGLSFLLLLVVFRSVLVPLKAVIMNLLSIGASYGVIVAVFQHGWGAGLLGLGRPGPIESFLPMMMFAILFGLSMDYEVFLLTRIKEEYDRTGENALAVADGVSATARVITAAALIMVTVFGSFVFGPDRVIKMFGLGLAVAVLLDATVVRLLLVPATMELLGKANWWMPRWLSWLPKVHVEGTRFTEVVAHRDQDATPVLDPGPADPS